MITELLKENRGQSREDKIKEAKIFQKKVYKV